MPPRIDTKSKFGLSTASRASPNSPSAARLVFSLAFAFRSPNDRLLSAVRFRFSTPVARTAQRFGSKTVSPPKISSAEHLVLVEHELARAAAGNPFGGLAGVDRRVQLQVQVQERVAADRPVRLQRVLVVPDRAGLPSRTRPYCPSPIALIGGVWKFQRLGIASMPTGGGSAFFTSGGCFTSVGGSGWRCTSADRLSPAASVSRSVWKASESFCAATLIS